MNHKDSVSILSLLRPLVKQILEDMMEEERRGYLRELRERIRTKEKAGVNQKEEKDKDVEEELEGGDISYNFNNFDSLKIKP